MEMHNPMVVKAGRGVAGIAALVMGAVFGISTANAAALDTTYKTANPAQVKKLLGEDSGKVSGKNVVYSGKSVHVVAAMVLPGFPFPSFEVHDVKDATLEIPAGATVHFTVINTNKGFSHSFQITTDKPPFPVMPKITPVAGTGFIPQVAGSTFHYADFTWKPKAGTYHYICTIPGHAATGMNGEIVVK